MKDQYQATSRKGRHLPSQRRTLRIKQALVLSLGALIGMLWIGLAAWRSVSADSALTVSTVAGSSDPGGIDFQNARGITLAPGSSSVIFIADTSHHVVRKIDTTTATPTVTIVAGTLDVPATNAAAANGDGAAATSAQLNSPSDVAVDSSGNLYIADTANNKIRKVDVSDGKISTIAGNGQLGALDGSATGASLAGPRGVAVDGNGNLYVADTGNNKIRRISGGTIQTIAGSGTANFFGDGSLAVLSDLNAPLDVAVDTNGNIYIADTGNNRVRVINTSGVIDTFAGNGTTAASGDGAPLSVTIIRPSGVAVDGSNRVYIADTGNHRIRLVNGSSLTTVAGTGTQGFDGDGSDATARSLSAPYSVVANQAGTEIFFLDAGNHRLRKTSSTGLSTVLSDGADGYSGDTGPAVAARLRVPLGVAVDSAGNFYIADTSNHAIRKVTISDGKITTIAGTGQASTDATAANGDEGPAVNSTLNSPSAVAVDAAGNIYIADTGNHRIRKIDLVNNISTVAGIAPVSGIPTAIGAVLGGPRGVAVDSNGNLYIADTGNNRIRLLTPGGTMVNFAGSGLSGSTGDGGLATSAKLSQPRGVAVDALGNAYIADTNNHRIRRVANGTITTVVAQGLVRPLFDGDGGLAVAAHVNTPSAIAVDASGNFYLADTGNNRIRKVTISDNKINTIISNGTIGFSGDGGLATNAAFSVISGLAVGTAGVYVADTGNNRIRLAAVPPNVAPVLTSPGNKTLNEGDGLSFTLAASDTSGQTLTYSMTGAPSGATLDSATGAFSYSPSFSVVGHTVGMTPTPVPFTVIFKATDDGTPALEASQTITITVNDVNRAPVVSAGTIPAQLEATSSAGATLALNGSATDADGDPLTVTWTDTFNSATTTIANTAVSNAPLSFGSHLLVLTATDDRTGTATTVAKTVVVQDSQAPVFSGVPADITHTISSGTTDIVSYIMPTATDAISGAVTVTASTLSGAAFPIGATTVTFTATDARNNTATATFKVTITLTGGGGGNGTTTTYDIAAFAGTGTYGSSGDAGAATAATFKQPQGVAVDSAGNVYLADAEARVVRKVNASDGKIVLFAGTGTKGFSGDAGAATAAKLNYPTGVAVDSAGNVYLADTNNHRVRKVNASDGKINTIAGIGFSGFSGDAGASVSAKLSGPTAVAVDAAGNIFVADTGNNRVRKINASDGKINTIAGNGASGYDSDNIGSATASLDHPTGLAVSADGNTIFIADTGNNRIRKVTGGTITTFAGDGTVGSSGDSAAATAASLNAPTGVVLDGSGNLLITDAGNERIRKITASDGKINTVVGTGVAGNAGDGGAGASATLDTPTAIALNAASGLLYFSDAGNLRVRKLTPVIVGPVNHAPVPDPIFNQSLNKNQTLNVALSATDADGDPITFSLVPSLAFVTITTADPPNGTAVLHIAPNNANVGAYNLQIKAADNKGGSNLTAVFALTVNDPNSATNHPPVASATTLASPIEAVGPSGAQVNLNGSGSSDVDGDTLTYQWSDNGTVFATTAAATRALSLGSHTLVLTVNDGHGGSNNTSQTVLVRDTTPPVISVTPNAVTFAPGVQVTLPSPTVSDTVDTAVTVTNDAPQSYPTGTTVVTFTATDHSGNSATTQVSVTVGSPGPQLTSIDPVSGAQGQVLTMRLSGTGFLPGASISFSGGGITATVSSVSSTEIVATIKISDSAAVGTSSLNRRSVTVTNSGGGGSSTLQRVFSVNKKF